jgi:hypothetical protein
MTSDNPSVMSSERSSTLALTDTATAGRTGPRIQRDHWLAALALAAVPPLALAIHYINRAYAEAPEQAVMRVGLLLGVLVAIPALAYLVTRGRAATAPQLAEVVLATIIVALVGIDAYWIMSNVVFPADFLIWSESDFVNDIIKLRIGYPLFTEQANNESFNYLPGAQLVTYWLTAAAGASSIAAYRGVQVLFIAVAAVIAARSALDLAGTARHPDQGRPTILWTAICVLGFFLLASNSITNPYVQHLHNDSLAQLITVAAFALLVRHALAPARWQLVAMAILPGIGFMVKQTLAIWAVFYLVQLALFDHARSLRRALLFGVAAFATVLGGAGLCYLLWGEHVIYWAFTVLEQHGISPLRAFQHVLNAWGYFAIGALGGLALLRGDRTRTLLGPWLIWLGLLGSEAYTSGAAWMLNHMGPGSLVAGIWLFGALPHLWRDELQRLRESTLQERWIRPAMVVLGGLVLLGGLGVIRVPLAPFGRDAQRYVSEIEREFEGLPASRVLLDAGSWLYQQDGIVMKDRAPSIGERGHSATGDFSGILGRITRQEYAKIMVRKMHEPDFWYDHSSWGKSSGIRAALLANYREVRTIPGIPSLRSGRPDRYLFHDITVLVPNF